MLTKAASIRWRAHRTLTEKSSVASCWPLDSLTLSFISDSLLTSRLYTAMHKSQELSGPHQECPQQPPACPSTSLSLTLIYDSLRASRLSTAVSRRSSASWTSPGRSSVTSRLIVISCWNRYSLTHRTSLPENSRARKSPLFLVIEPHQSL